MARQLSSNSLANTLRTYKQQPKGPCYVLTTSSNEKLLALHKFTVSPSWATFDYFLETARQPDPACI